MEQVGLDALVDVLKAVGEPSRLRILSVLRHSELTVGELCRVLGQSQPRVSRHLRVLVDVGLLERHAEGTSAFYRAARVLGGIPDEVLRRLDTDDAVIRADRRRLDAVRAERAAEAAAYFEAIAADWARIRELHVADETVEAALLAAVEDRRVGTLLDIGTGTGRMLELFADRVDRGLGVDLSPRMLNLARTTLDKAGLDHCSVRHGNVYDLRVPDGSMDVAVLHHVLHFLDQPADAIALTARTLHPGGRLLIVDFAPHDLEELRTEYAHRRLGFADDEVRTWCELADLSVVGVHHFTPQLGGDRPGEALTVSLWVAESVPATVDDALPTAEVA